MSITSMSRVQVNVRDITFGTADYLLCVSLPGKNQAHLISLAEIAKESHPDLFEWRIDFMDTYPNTDGIVESAKNLRTVIPNTPIIVTARHEKESGVRPAADEQRLKLLWEVAQSDAADMIDMELRFGANVLEQYVERFHSLGKKVILSHHELERVLSRDEIYEVLQRQQEWGADVAKLVMHTESYSDLAEYGKTLIQAKQDFLNIPLIAGIDGGQTALMRFVSDRFGSCMTFAAADGVSSHPSQVSIDAVRKIREILS